MVKLADGKIIFDTEINKSGVKSGLKEVKSDFSRLENSVKSIGKTIGAAFSVAAISAFGKKCIEVGSNVAEVQNVVDVAFGDMAYKIESFSETAIETFGMSRLAAKKTASTYMAMAKGMGISEESASEMAIGLTGLTGDVASFFNISQELADVKLKSVFTGETETLKDLGIVMTQANLQAFALSKGISKNISDMSQAELVGLRYNFVVDQLRLASGDFARTQSSWANQTRILSENFKELMAVLGQGLIQVLTPVLSVLNRIVTALINAANVAGRALSSLFGIEDKQIQSSATSAAALNGEISDSVKNQEALTEETKRSEKAANTAAAGFDELNILSDTSSSSAAPDSSGSTLADFKTVSVSVDDTEAEGSVNKIKKLFNDLSGEFKEKYTPAIKAWGGAFGELKKPVSDAVSSIKRSSVALWKNTLKPLGDKTKNEFVPAIVNSFSENVAPIFSDVMSVAVTEFAKDYDFACQQVSKVTDDVIVPMMDTAQMVYTDTLESVGSTWDEYGTSILNGFREMKESLRKIWESIYDNILAPIFNRLFEVIDWLWTKHLKPLWDNINEFFGNLVSCVYEIWNKTLAPVVNWVVGFLAPRIANAVNFIIDVVGTVVATVADVAGGIIRALKGVISMLTGVFTGNWEKAWEGLLDFTGGITDAIWGIIKGSLNAIIDGLNAVWRAVYTVFSEIANGIGDAVGWIGSLMGKDWGFSLPKKPPLIPKLAQGAVIPANREFLAVLGDQKSGVNIETPLDTMIQAFKAALAESGHNGSGEIVINNVLTLDGEVVYRNQERIKTKRGTATVLNGAFAR